MEGAVEALLGRDGGRAGPARGSGGAAGRVGPDRPRPGQARRLRAELSSVIDLVVFYEPAPRRRATGGDPKPFFVKLAQGLVKLLADRTADGYVHRIDCRLRPDGTRAPSAVALSTGFAFDYYQTLGQNWERAASHQGPTIAGDIPAGEAFLAELAPFIWRRHFDFRPSPRSTL